MLTSSYRNQLGLFPLKPLAGASQWLCLVNNVNSNTWPENSSGTYLYDHYYFVRATLILHDWSWLSTTFMYSLKTLMK